MLNINFTQAIPSIVEAMLPRFSSEKIGLSVTLDLRDDDYDTDKDAATTCRLLFHRPSNYTKVLVNYTFNEFNNHATDPRYNIVYFEKHSDHDSCWKSDGLRILDIHWKNVHQHFSKHPSKLSNFYSFSIFDTIGYVEFEKFEPVKETGGAFDGYVKGYNIKIKRKIPISEIGNFIKEG